MTTAVSPGRREAQASSSSAVVSAPDLPQPWALLRGGGATPDGDRPILELDRRVGMGLEIQPPRRLGLAPAVHGHGHQVRTVLVVAKDGGTLAAALPADRLQPHHAPGLLGGRSQAQPSAAEPMDGPMDDPGGADDESGWQPPARLAGGIGRGGGHRGSSFGVAGYAKTSSRATPRAPAIWNAISSDGE